ncbi:MAG: hypothetical protein AAFV93_16460, partial [Chloroflexota bacterium]
GVSPVRGKLDTNDCVTQSSRQFSIFTTVLEGQDINNTACVRADNSDSEDCVTQSFVSSLPRTGETPLVPTLLVTNIFLLLGGVMMIVHLSITSE